MRGGTGVRCSAVKLWFSQSQQPQLRDAPMGSAFSTDGVWVQCESPGPYAGGDTVRGVVCVNLTKEKHFKDITLKVTGKEACCYSANVYTDGKHRREQRWGSREFFKVKVPLSKEVTLQPGQYQYGFVFVLPPHLPSSFTYEHGNLLDSSKAYVYYKVKAVCDVPGMLKSDLKHKLYISIAQPDTVPPKPANNTNTSKIKSLGMFSKGEAVATLEVETDRLAPGQPLLLRVQVDNRSSAHFHEIEVSLKQQISMQADWAPARVDKHHILEAKLEGVAPHTALQGGLARTASLVVPQTAQPSVSAQIVSNSYMVQATLKGGATTTDLKVKVPVFITPPSVVPPTTAEPFYSAPPPEWQPTQVYDPVAVQLPSAPPLPPDALGSNFWRIASGKPQV